MKIEIKDRSLLDNHVNKFIKKASNPQSLTPFIKLSLSSTKQSRLYSNIKGLSFFDALQNKQVKDVSPEGYKTSRLSTSEQLSFLIQKNKAPLSSRLLVQEDRDTRMMAQRQRLAQKEDNFGDFAMYGRARVRVKAAKNRRTCDRLQKRQKIKSLFEKSVPKLEAQGRKIKAPVNNSTTIGFFGNNCKPWQTVRINDRTVVLGEDKGSNLWRRRASVFYRTLHN